MACIDLRMEIRPATKEDVPAIVALLADDKLGRIREDYHIPLPKTYYRAFEAIQQDPNQELMVLESVEKRVIGTFQLSHIPYLTYRGGIRSQIEAVRIHKDLRSQGLGELIFRWAISRAKEKGAHLLQLTTDKQRPEAKHFYQKIGFVDSHDGMKLHLSSHTTPLR